MEKQSGYGIPRTVAEVDLDALRHNARAAGAYMPGGAASVMAVVKANGYGMGLAPVSLALESTVGAFGVACLEEALALRAAGVKSPIYMLGPALPEEREAVARGGFVPPVSDLAEARAFAEAAEACGKVLPVCAVLDTGMGRIGALPGAAAALLEVIRSSPSLTLDSLASHFPSADEDVEWTRRQEESFDSEVAALRAAGHHIPLTHIANSAGLSGYARRGGELARAGIILYGVSPLPEKQAELKTVLTWKVKVTQVRELPVGWTVSYGRSHEITRPTVVATLAAGYADGYPRQVSGRGAHVLLGGVRCPVLGRVTMDQLMADVSALAEPVRCGDDAVLLGRQGAEEITAGELAAWADTIPWHILTALGTRVARRYTTGGAAGV